MDFDLIKINKMAMTKYKMTKMEDYQDGRQPKWKKSKKEDNQKERRPKVEKIRKIHFFGGLAWG